MQSKILIIDDNKAFVEMLQDLLESEGFAVDYFLSTDEIEDYIILNKYDLVLLDIALGDTDGVSFLKMIRQDIKSPVLFLTAKNTKDDILTGLNSGGDDYITKPFDNDYLVAKIKSHIRRDLGEPARMLDFSGLTIDSGDQRVCYAGQDLKFTKSEFDIVFLLANNPDTPHSKEQIFTSIYSISPNSEIRVITQYIYQIRSKFSEVDLDPIENIWGVGYKWKLH